jgi:adenylosuccinate lyase
MATEKLMVRSVRSGGDRQEVHEIIRRHSIEAARAVKDGAQGNDLLDRLAADPELGLSLAEMRDITRAEDFVGRAPQQVDEFLRDVADPILASEGTTEREPEAIRV